MGNKRKVPGAQPRKRHESKTATRHALDEQLLAGDCTMDELFLRVSHTIAPGIAYRHYKKDRVNRYGPDWPIVEEVAIMSGRRSLLAGYVASMITTGICTKESGVISLTEKGRRMLDEERRALEVPALRPPPVITTSPARQCMDELLLAHPGRTREQLFEKCLSSVDPDQARHRVQSQRERRSKFARVTIERDVETGRHWILGEIIKSALLSGMWHEVDGRYYLTRKWFRKRERTEDASHYPYCE